MKKIGDKFEQLQKKHLMWAIVKSVVCGGSLGLFVTGVFLLAFKLGGVYLAPLYYALIGVGLAAISGGMFYWLLFKPTAKKVAKYTDDEYGLNERVQTALAYSDKSGTLVELQREDAEEKLNSLPERKFSFAKIWQFCLIGFIALAIGVAGITVPASAETGYAKDPNSRPRTATEEELAGVRELIADIENSSLSTPLKSSVGDDLNQLLTDLGKVKTEGEMSDTVFGAISAVSGVLSPTLTYQAIGSALAEFDQGYLGQAVTNGGGVYQYYMLTLYDEVRVFDAVKYDAANIKVSRGISPLRNNFALTISGGLPATLTATYSGTLGALAVSGIPASDALYGVVKSFADSVLQIKTKYQNSSDDAGAQAAIDTLMGTFVVELTSAVSEQAYNAAINVFVANRLKTIFNYPPLELPLIDPDKGDPEETDPSKPGEGNPNNPNGPGSSGDGETQYGSDDEVWVPGRGYMKYGDVIDEYYALINQYLHSDELTEEQKNMIRAYYDILFGSGGNK